MVSVDDSQSLIDQQVLVVVEFVMGAEARFASTPPAGIVSLQEKLLSKTSGVPGYSITDPLEFYRLLRVFSQRSNPTMGELSEALSVSFSTATRAANFLVKNGWAQRQSDETDRRIIRMALTDSGKEALDTINRSLFSSLREMLGYLIPEDRIELTRILKTLTGLIEPR